MIKDRLRISVSLRQFSFFFLSALSSNERKFNFNSVKTNIMGISLLPNDPNRGEIKYNVSNV